MSLAVIFLFESTLTGDGEARRDGRGGIRPASQSDLALLVPWAGADFVYTRQRSDVLVDDVRSLCQVTSADWRCSKAATCRKTNCCLSPSRQKDIEQHFPGCRFSGSLRLQA